MPLATGAQREQVLGFEAGQIAGGALADVVWAHAPVSPGVVEREVVAVMKLAVGEGLCAEIGRWGLTVDRIVPAGWALVRALRHNYPEVVGPAVVVWIDGRTALLVRVERTDIAVRLVGLPGAGVAPDRPQVLATTADPKSESHEREAAPWLDRVAVELARMAGSGASAGAGQIDVFLGGDEGVGPGEVALLALRAAVRVTGFDALRRVRIGARASGADKVALQMGVVVGLALAAGDAGIDLLPPARRRERSFRRVKGRWLGLAAVAVAGLLAALFVLRRERLGLEREASVVAARLVPQRVAEQKQREGERERALLRQQLDALAAIRAARSVWLDWLVDMQERLTQVEDVWLDSLAVRPQPAGGPAAGGAGLGGSRAVAGVEAAPAEGLRIAVTGRVLRRPGAEPLERVRRLREGLLASRFVAAVEDERFDDAQPGLLRFSCTLVMKPEVPL